MTTLRTALPAVGLVLCLTGASLAAQSASKERTFRLTYTAVVKEVPAGARLVDLWLPYPQSDANQAIHAVTVEAPGPVTLGREPKFGNIALHYRGPASAGTRVAMEITATRRENSGLRETLTPAEAKQYLVAEPLVPLDGPVKAVADEAVKGKKTDAEKARAIYEKVTGMMKYDKSGTGWGRGDAIFACDAKRGNCTDFHALIIGAARSQGIPARFAIGVSVPEKRGTGEVPGYHCWAEMYVRGQGWVPLDSSEGAKALATGDVARKDYYYGHHDENRLEFSRGRFFKVSPPQQGEPLNFFIYPYAEADGKKLDTVERAVTYTDVDSLAVRR